MNTQPSPGALAAENSLSPWINYADKQVARIIDAHTNAIADELAEALDMFMVRYRDTVIEYRGGRPAGVYVRSERFDHAAEVLARYNAARNKEAV